MKPKLSFLLFLLFLSAVPLRAAVGIDQTVSGDKSSSASSVSTPVFSTVFGNELLLAFVSTDAKRSGMTVANVSGAGLSWTLVRRTNTQLGTAEIWRAFTIPALSGVSVRASLSQSVAASITVVTFSGVDTSGVNGSGAIGAVAGASASSGAPTVTLVTTKANSWVFAVGTDWDRAVPRTPGPDQILVHQFMPTVGDTYWVQRQNYPTPLAGTSVTINDTAPTNDRYNLSACEILSALSSPTYGISGIITPAGISSGATVTLSGAASANTTVDASGNYSFSGLANGSYTITPAKAGVTFSPASQNAIVNGSNLSGMNFTAAAVTYGISGTITPAGSSSGATVSLSGAASANTTVDASGNYSFSGLANGSYTITPTKAGVTFSPASQNATVNGSNLSGMNFTAAAVTYGISGTITPAGSSSGATVSLSGAASANTTVDASGNYSFSGLAIGSYTITPTKAGVTFSPASQNATVNGSNLSGMNFTAAAVTYGISGTITPAGISSGATVTLSGAASANTTVDASGNYSFSGLANGSYTITPTKAGVTFSLSSQNATVNGSNLTGINFTAAAVTYSISGIITPAGSSNGATVTLSGTANANTTVDASGNYSFSGLANGSYTITPAKVGLTFSPASQNATVNGSNLSGINFTAAAVTYSISGTITPAGSSSGATVSLSGAASANTTVDASGNYSFSGLANGSYTITPTKAGVTFSPSSQNATVNGSNLSGINFTAAAVTYSISGTITPAASSSGATVSLSGAASANTTVDASGDYNFSGLANGSYTITPAKAGFTFSPASQVVNITNANVLGKNFVCILASELSLDAVIWGDSNTPSTSVTTPAFSTAAGDELLLAFISTDGISSGMTVTGVAGGGLTWTLVRRTNAQLGTAEIWRAYAVQALSGISVRASLGQSVASSIIVVSFTGADSSGTNGSAAVGATASANASSGAPSATLITTRNRSWVFGVGNDWDRAIARTPGSNQTVIHQFMPTVGDTYWVQRQNYPTPLAGTSVTINDTAPTGDRYNLTACEILPAQTLPIPTYSISGSITPIAIASGTTIALTGTATATTSLDAFGNYSFSGLQNGSYAVTPTKPGVTFTPPAVMLAVADANIVGANFIATSEADTWSISGEITPFASGSGATLTLSGTASAVTTADATGAYIFSGFSNGSYSVLPTKTGFAFSPTVQGVTVKGADVTGIDFIATATWSIAGTITPASNGAGALLTLTGTSNAITTADASGDYSFSGLKDGAYTVTPSKSGFTFSPGSANVNVNGANVTGTNFTATSLAANFVIDGSTTYQAMDGMGANLNAKSWSDGGNNGAWLDWLITTAGISNVRLVKDRMDWIDSQSTTKPTATLAALEVKDPATLESVYGAGATDPEMSDLWSTVAKLNALGLRGDQITVAFMGYTAKWMSQSGPNCSSNHSGTGGTYGQSWICDHDAMATMIASLVYYGRVVRGLDFGLVSPFNEWNWNGLEGPYLTNANGGATGDDWADIISRAITKMTVMDSSVANLRFTCCDRAGDNGYGSVYDSAAAVLGPRIASHAGHDYHGSTSPTSIGTDPSHHGWITETAVAECNGCDQGGSPSVSEWQYGKDQFDLLLNDVAEGWNSALYWEATDGFWYHHQYDSGGNGWSRWGLMQCAQTITSPPTIPTCTDILAPRLRGFALAPLFKAALPGTTRIAVTAPRGVTAIAFHDPGAQVIGISGRNGNSNSVTLTGRFTGMGSTSPSVLQAWLTNNAGKNLEAQADIVVTAGSDFSFTVPADTIFVLVNAP